MQDTFNLILLLEIVVPLLLLSIALSVVILGRKHKDKKALQHLISQYKDKEDGRRESVIKFLKSKADLEDPVRKDAAKKLLQARKSFLQKLINAYLTRKPEAISNLDNELSIITRAYHEISITIPQEKIVDSIDRDDSAPVEDIRTVTQNGPELDEELKNLREKNNNLEIELQTTLSTLNSIFSEYTSMFGEETEKKDMSVDDILSAMESFGQDNIDSAAKSDDIVGDAVSETETETEQLEKTTEPETEEPQKDVEAKQAEDAEMEKDAEPSWDEAFEEAKESQEDAEAKQTEDAEMEKDAEPSWDEAFEEIKDSQEDAEAKLAEDANETERNDEPSWDEVLKEANDDWGDDTVDTKELDNLDDDSDDTQPEWGNAVEEELEEPDKEK